MIKHKKVQYILLLLFKVHNECTYASEYLNSTIRITSQRLCNTNIWSNTSWKSFLSSFFSVRLFLKETPMQIKCQSDCTGSVEPADPHRLHSTPSLIQLKTETEIFDAFSTSTSVAHSKRIWYTILYIQELTHWLSHITRKYRWERWQVDLNSSGVLSDRLLLIYSIGNRLSFSAKHKPCIQQNKTGMQIYR